MALTRLSPTNDSGAGTDGTIFDAAYLTTIEDMVDARWSEYTITSTGTQNDLSITNSSVECDILRCNNATALTINGLAAPASPAKPGKPLLVLSVGAGQVNFAHQNTSSSAANRLINRVTSGITPLAAGVGWAMFRYDATASRWRLLAHEQGGAIAITYASGNFTSSAGTWVVDSGDVATEAYIVRGKSILFMLSSSTTTVTGTPAQLRFALPNSYTAVRVTQDLLQAVDNGTKTSAVVSVAAAGTYVSSERLDGSNWANATNATAITFLFEFELT